MRSVRRCSASPVSRALGALRGRDRLLVLPLPRFAGDEEGGDLVVAAALIRELHVVAGRRYPFERGGSHAVERALEIAGCERPLLAALERVVDDEIDRTLDQRAEVGAAEQRRPPRDLGDV